MSKILDELRDSLQIEQDAYREAAGKVAKARELFSSAVAMHYNLDAHSTTQVVCIALRKQIPVHRAYQEYVEAPWLEKSLMS